MRQEHAVQTAALKASHHRSGFAFFMEQGLGKTYTALKEFEGLVQERLASRMVVICPNSFKAGWVAEIEKWRFDFEPHIFESGSWSNAAFIKREFGRAPVLVVNIEAIRSEETRRLITKFAEGRSVYCAVDESILISTHDSAQTKATLDLRSLFKYRRILSGKPMKQGPHDLWSQMRFIGELEGRNFYAFRNAFCKMGGYKAKQVVGAQNEDLLARLIDHAIFRATKEDWTDLPPKVQMIREYQLSPEMAAKYKQMHDEFVLWLTEDKAVTVDAAITKYIKLAQIQCGFIYDEDHKTNWLVEPKKNPRLSLMLDILENEIPGKAAIVYHHKPSLALLGRALEKYNPAWIKGQMASWDIDDQKKRFNEDPSCRVILLQDDASKYGHTLLGDGSGGPNGCADMIFFQNNYSLDTRSQIEDRPHRHGQNADMVRYWDLVGTPLDRDCVKALFRKESVFKAVFSLLTKTSASALSAR